MKANDSLFSILLFILLSADLLGQRMWTEEVPGAGPVIVADYFEAKKFQKVKERLDVVENYHLSKQFWDYYRKQQFEYAMSDLVYTLNRFPNHPLALKLVSGIATLTNRPATPLPFYEKAIRYFPEHALTHAQYGTYLVELGKLDLGIMKLIDATKIDPKLAVAFADLARAYLKKGESKRAEEAAQKARELGYKDEILPERGEPREKDKSAH